MPHALSMPASGFQAVILCGPGVSLTTFTANPEEFPKALVPIANRPMVWYPLDWCYRMGITSQFNLLRFSLKFTSCLLPCVLESLFSLQKLEKYIHLYLDDTQNLISMKRIKLTPHKPLYPQNSYISSPASLGTDMYQKISNSSPRLLPQQLSPQPSPKTRT